MVRTSIGRLKQLGPLPSEEQATVEQLKEYEDLLLGIARPVTDEEARVLSKLSGLDDCFGLAWTMLQLIQTACRAERSGPPSFAGGRNVRQRTRVESPKGIVGGSSEQLRALPTDLHAILI
jgi:hypothetical protein